jgi:hypothetical protein
VVGDVGERTHLGDLAPNALVEDFGNLICHAPRLTM